MANLKKEWKKNEFLKANRNKQGRKLDLDRFHKWSSLVHTHEEAGHAKKGQVHRFINPNKAPTDDRRDDMRFHLRAKMSQKNYVNKEMKNYHYSSNGGSNPATGPLTAAMKEMDQEGAERIESLKK